MKYVGNGIIHWGQLIADVLDDIELRINQTRNSETTSLVTVLLEGILYSSLVWYQLLQDIAYSSVINYLIPTAPR